eukprot:g3519.t1
MTSLLADRFGIGFVAAYIASYMLVSLGIFNVILAVYVEITMKAAKETDATTAEQYARESIRVARTTRELLKKFAAAYRIFQELEEQDQVSRIEFRSATAIFTDEDVHDKIVAWQALMMYDRDVQRLMDELDLPPDRANLFEVIDADGSGTLHITELIKKSDAVAALLATKAVQSMVADTCELYEKNLDVLRSTLQTELSYIRRMNSRAPASAFRSFDNRCWRSTRKVMDMELEIKRLRQFSEVGSPDGSPHAGQPRVAGRNLHDAIEALGLTSYSEEEVNDLVNQLADYIDLKFMTKDAKDAACFVHFRGDKAVLDRSNSAQATPFFWDNDQKMGRPIWHWPREAEFSRSVSREMPTTDLPARNNFNVVPLQALMDLFLARDADLHKKIFGPANRKQYIEPFVAILILVNGIMIGFQTDRTWEDWTGWKYMEGVLAFFLLLESCMRMYLSGMREFFLGSDWAWNWFDLILMITGVTDVIFQAVGGLESDMFASSLLRFCRLIRLVRVVKIFRLKCMKERAQPEGGKRKTAGNRTLALAFPLLFAVLYVISGFATMTIGRDERAIELELAQGFENIFWSMFTAFRCFCGECNSAKGLPIHAILAEELDYGFAFVAGYIISYMLVTLGIFNVILAVYVDITMRAAKETEATTSEQHARESIRIARTTRELLKKFAQAYRSFQEADEAGQIGASKTRNTLDLNEPSSAYTDEDIHEIAISKELFLLVIQDSDDSFDRTVQTLMDELDLPPDRANLFEVIDADGSGTMDVTELVQGMLKIRGEVKKSDTVATLLATKALQEMVALLDASLRVLKRNLLEAYSEAAQGSPLFVERSAEKFEAELQSLTLRFRKGRWNPDSPTRPSISFSPQQGSELGEPIKEDEDVEDGETSEESGGEGHPAGTMALAICT